jgi:hypothetical protein
VQRGAADGVVRAARASHHRAALIGLVGGKPPGRGPGIPRETGQQAPGRGLVQSAQDRPGQSLSRAARGKGRAHQLGPGASDS